MRMLRMRRRVRLLIALLVMLPLVAVVLAQGTGGRGIDDEPITLPSCTQRQLEAASRDVFESRSAFQDISRQLSDLSVDYEDALLALDAHRREWGEEIAPALPECAWFDTLDTFMSDCLDDLLLANLFIHGQIAQGRDDNLESAEVHCMIVDTMMQMYVEELE